LSDTKLSELSLEERMAYYKQKYDKSGSSQGKTMAPKGAGHSEKKRDMAGSRKRGKRNQESAAEPKGNGSTPVPASGNSVQNQNTDQESVTSENVTKKGFLSRLTGIFRKKQE
jgi:hypothetical protein